MAISHDDGQTPAAVDEIDSRESAEINGVTTEAPGKEVEVETSRDDGGGIDTGVNDGEPPENGDLKDAQLSDADRKLDAVYGDHVHQNPGQHLHAGIAEVSGNSDSHARLFD